MAEQPKDTRPDYSEDPMPREGTTGQSHPVGHPVARPSPTADGKKQVAAGAEHVENFNVSTDTNGGG
jgi:hypothetical protein